MKWNKIFCVLFLEVSLLSFIYCHVDEGDRKDTICEYFMDEKRGYVARCPNVILKDENQHVRFTGNQMEKKTNEDVRYLEIVPPSNIAFLPSLDIFTYFVNLENLDIRNVNIHTLDYIYNCFPIVYMTLNNNNIKEILHDTFFICRDLVILDLSKNEIKKIHENAFGQTKNMRELDLSFNQLDSLPRKLLKPIKKLRNLNLRNNRLKTVPYNALNDLFDLSFLDMSNNLISSLDVRFFDFVMYLETLNLSGTNIKKFLPGTFKSLKRLKFLDISHNKLSSLDGEMLSKNTEIEEIRINDCLLYEIGQHFFDKLPKLTLVEAKGNNCADGVYKGSLNEITENFKVCLQNSDKNQRHGWQQNTEL